MNDSSQPSRVWGLVLSGAFIVAMIVLLFVSKASTDKANEAARKATKATLKATQATQKSNAALSGLRVTVDSRRTASIQSCQRANIQIRTAINGLSYIVYMFAKEAAEARAAEGQQQVADSYEVLASSVVTLRYIDCVKATDHPELPQRLTQPGPPNKNGTPPGQKLPTVNVGDLPLAPVPPPIPPDVTPTP